MIIIRPYTENDRSAWDAYVHAHSSGTLFHRIAWKQVVEQSFGHRSHYLIARDEANGAIEGILPVFRIRSMLFGDFMVSVPFAEQGGPLADNIRVRDALIGKAARLAERFDCDYFEMRNRAPIDDFPVKNLYFNFRREILPTDEENLKAIPRKQRRMVRQGEKFGLTAEFGHHLIDDFYRMLARSFHHLGTPVFPKRFFANFLKIFEKDADLLLVRAQDRRPVAAVLTFYFKDQVLPYYAGSLFEARRLAPNDFMYWELMRRGRQRGFKWFDFGRSKAGTGSYQFKIHWGFQPRPLAYQYHLVRLEELPNLSPANPKYRKKIELWRRMPFGLTKLAGPPLARYLA